MNRLFLLLGILFLYGTAFAAEPKVGRVVGQIECQKEECVGLAALWKADTGVVPAPDRHQLIPAVVSALEADGSFELVAPAGLYFAGAQFRKTPGPLFGAPRAGDQLYMIRPNDDQGYPVTITEDQVTDIGLHSDFWVFKGLTEKPLMGISGTVLDLDQQPVAGLLVFAFADPGANLAPLAVSGRTGDDGQFELPLTSSGQVYLRVRKNYRGGQPQAEDYVGVSSADSAKPISVDSGKITRGVKVLVRKLPSVLERKNAPNNSRPQLN